MDKAWFDLRPLVKRRYAQSVWIPLGLFQDDSDGEYGSPGWWSSFEGAHSVAVPIANREYGERYSWSDNHDPRPWAGDGFYKPADVYSHNEEVDVGFRLALRQSVSDQPSAIWHLHQDFVLALELILEGDIWVRPAEGYVEVARLQRNKAGKPVGIEAKAEFLRDYLAARGCALRIASYRDRKAIVDDVGEIDFPRIAEPQEIFDGRLEERAWAIDSSGSPFGSRVGVFKAARNDVDPDEDVPVMGPEDTDNVESTNWSFTREDGKFYRIASEFWRDEWVEPAAQSPRVRGDDVASQVTFVVEADGTRMNADELNHEEIGRWLWFKPGIAAALLARRGAKLDWYTRYTGGLSTPSDPSVHFGINESGLITVYAHDVARLPEWERRLWAGFNVTPEGKVSAELLSAQVRVEPADTQAPEAYFAMGLRHLKLAWGRRFKTALLRTHDQQDEILSRIHRFRALDRPGLLSLAKDVARLTADSIEPGVAQAIAPPEKGQKIGSLKSLERALATIVDAETAREVMGPLFAAYDLRLSDAHLPRSDLLAAYALLDTEEIDSPLTAGFKLLNAVVGSLYGCVEILRSNTNANGETQ